MRMLMDRLKAHWQKERGQSIVIFALSLVALLLFAGLAVDVGVIFIGREELSRGVDAAVLAGVTELPRSGKPGADVRAQQYLDVNKIDFETGLAGFESAEGFSAIGAWRYQITVTRQIDLYFLPLINFDHFTTREMAIAEYNPQLEMYTDQPGIYEGMQNTVNLMNWGPLAKRRYGDAYTPLYANSPNPYWPELEGVYRYRIHVPESYPESVLRVELFDPDCFNVSNAVVSPLVIPHSLGLEPDRTQPVTPPRVDAVVIYQGDWDSFNPYWFVRIDENRYPYNQSDGAYDPSYNTTTAYHLFYYSKLADGTIITQTLATYIHGGAESDNQTDMKWVCPGGSLPSRDPAVTWGPKTFEVNLDELKNDPHQPMHVDPGDGHVSLFLDVEGISGSSENGWDLWAGPVYPDAPAEVNERNIYAVNYPNALDTEGVVTYAMGHLPWNINANNESFTATITYIGPEMAGRELSVAHFDNDAGAEQIRYTFDTMPWQDWFRDGMLSGQDQWLTDTFKVPEPPTHTFYGGYLQARYFGGYQDTSVWKLEASGSPVLVK